MNVLETFLNLTSSTYPYGCEGDLEPFLPSGAVKDPDGNYYLKIGDSRTIFTCHLDTACKVQAQVKHVFHLGKVKTDGTSILGADDKAGMTVLLYMISRNVSGLYYFFIGEECGCVGSRAASFRNDFFSDYKRMISFDRRGTSSVITHQTSVRTCSDAFARALCRELSSFGLQFQPDDTGVYTDSAEFSSVIPECTNVSVGYMDEHTTRESQDIAFLEKLCRACAKADFESLPTERDHTKYEYKDYGFSKGRKGRYFYDSVGAYNRKDRKKGYKWKGHDRYDQPDRDYWDEPEYYYLDGRKVYYTTRHSGRRDKIDRHRQEFSMGGAPGTRNIDKYVAIRDMYLSGELTEEELKIIKEDFLDDTVADKDFYDYMNQVI